jgi:pyruvate dehydrogenase E1 component beta subunit
VTVAATGWMVHKSLAAAERLAGEGVSVEVVDLACLAPLDTATLIRSIKKTGRLVIAHEAWRVGGFGAEVAAVAAEHCFFDLDAPIVRVAAPQAPLPLSKPLRDAFLPDVGTVVDAVRSAMAA